MLTKQLIVRERFVKWSWPRGAVRTKSWDRMFPSLKTPTIGEKQMRKTSPIISSSLTSTSFSSSPPQSSKEKVTPRPSLPQEMEQTDSLLSSTLSSIGSPKKKKKDQPESILATSPTTSFPLGSLKSPLLDLSARKRLQPNAAGPWNLTMKRLT